jgi:rare lipoprotein A
MIRQMFTRALPLLAVALAGCSVVGYPGGVSGPLPAPRPAAARPSAAPPRTYEVLGVSYTTLASSTDYDEVGIASWYGEQFHGRPTASGETYDMYGLTAAHRTLPLQTCVEVRRVDDDRRVVVRVNDRGPFDPRGERIIDLSFSAAEAIGLVQPGTAEVEVRALDVDRSC